VPEWGIKRLIVAEAAVVEGGVVLRWEDCRRPGGWARWAPGHPLAERADYEVSVLWTSGIALSAPIPGPDGTGLLPVGPSGM
jgi:hypothetical protein